MQDFLNKDGTVQARCRPEDGTTVELLALACKGSSTTIGLPNDTVRNSPQTQSDSSESDILSDSNDSLRSAEDSDMSVVHDPIKIAAGVRHGVGIRLINKIGSKYVRGTCGGLLRMEAPNQPPRQVGLMAAHLLEQPSQDSMEQDNRIIDGSPIIGSMVHPKNPGTLPLYDWALFDATKLGFDHDTTSFTTARESEFPREGTVVAIRTSRGDLAGTLSSSSSGIMLNADQGFIQVRTIVMDKGAVLTKGDSGAWVLGDGCVYGYIIATNGDDHAYMVPMHTAITEIQNALSANVVSLAISAFPRPPVHIGTTHEHVRQTERSVIFSDDNTPRSPLRGLRIIQPDSSLLDSIEEATPDTPAATLQEQLPQVDQSQLESQRAEAFLGQGRIAEAIKILGSVVETRENILGANHLDCIDSKYKLSHLVEEELVVLEKSDIRRLTYQHELGRAHLAHGQISEAIGVLEDVAAVNISTLDTSDRHLLATQVVLAEAYLRANRASVAVNLYEHILAVTSTPSGEHEQIRAAMVPWLNMARRQLVGSISVANLSGQSGLLFVHQKK
ncbi:hypothetical protein LA080_000060 [Diaporthe eres]|nr:hypothetical protein LA080_000060 [Diaporthe eres]